jgi:hypothetical protein
MLLYHGSPQKFTDFKVSENLCRHDIQTILTEGVGIYMSRDIKVAKSYGEFLYTVEVDDTLVLDMTNFIVVRSLISKFSKNLEVLGFNLIKYIKASTLESMVSGIVLGSFSCTDMARELELLLDCNEYFHTDNNKITSVYKNLQKTQKDILRSHIIKFTDISLGTVYIGKNPKLLKILEVAS